MTDLSAFFERANEALAERGLSLSVGDARHQIVALQDRWGYKTHPAFRPMTHSTAVTGIFWQGERPVATMAGVPILLDGNLTAHLDRWGLSPGVTIALRGEAKAWADTVTGRAAFTGGFCMPETLRGSDLSRWLVPFMSRYIRAAMAHQYDAPCFYFVPESKRARGERYNPEALVPSAKFSDATEKRLMGCASVGFIADAVA